MFNFIKNKTMKRVYEHLISYYKQNPIISINDIQWIDLNLKCRHLSFTRECIVFKFNDGTFQTWEYDGNIEKMEKEYENIKEIITKFIVNK